MPTAIDASAASTAAPYPSPDAARGAAPGFAEALAAQTAAPTGTERLPTVALGTMLSSFAGMPVDTATPASSMAATGPGTVGAAGASLASTANGPGAAVLQAGERYLGVPYLWGGTDEATGFDCSGFVQQVFSDLGISLPRVSADQAKVGVEVGSLDAAQPGDLLFWEGTGGRPNHIAIYAGEGRMLDAPRSGEVVGYRDITRGAPDSVRRVTDPA